MPGRMSSPEDWDYVQLGARLRELVKPSFIAGKCAPGEHCPHCPHGEMEICGRLCSAVYRELHGFDPPKR